MTKPVLRVCVWIRKGDGRECKGKTPGPGAQDTLHLTASQPTQTRLSWCPNSRAKACGLHAKQLANPIETQCTRRINVSEPCCMFANPSRIPLMCVHNNQRIDVPVRMPISLDCRPSSFLLHTVLRRVSGVL